MMGGPVRSDCQAAPAHLDSDGTSELVLSVGCVPFDPLHGEVGKIGADIVHFRLAKDGIVVGINRGAILRQIIFPYHARDDSESRVTGVRREGADIQVALLIPGNDAGQIGEDAIRERSKFSQSLGSRELIIVRSVRALFSSAEYHHQATLPAEFVAKTHER